MSLGPSPILLPDLASYSAVKKFAQNNFGIRPDPSEIGEFSISANVEYWALITLSRYFSGHCQLNLGRGVTPNPIFAISQYGVAKN